MSAFVADLRHAFRLYRRTPVSSLIAVIVLAIGMTFVSAFVSLYVDLVLKPQAGFVDGGRLVTLGQTDGRSLRGLSHNLINRMAEEVTALEAVAGVLSSSLVTEQGEAFVPVALVTRSFFDGLQPALHAGRGFDLADHDVNAEPVVVISYRYWQEELDGADVIGTTLDLELRQMFSFRMDASAPAEEEEEPPPFRIVGIMAADMRGIAATETSIWLPLERAFLLAGDAPADMVESLLQTYTMASYGRLADGASVRAVVNEMRARYADRADEFRLSTNQPLDAVSGLVTNLNVARESRRQLALFLAASVLLALVAAANVSLFLLARAPGRRRELGIRMAVGAPLGRLTRQLASEAGLLVVVAALLGMLVSIWFSVMLRGLAFLRQAQWREVSLFDWRVLVLLGAFLLLLTLAVSLAPILGLKRLGIAASSRQIAARATVSQRVAGTLQIAIAGALGGAAIGFGWYLGALLFGYPGYELEDRYVVQHSINLSGMTNTNDFQQVINRANVELARRREAIEAIPGITAVSFGQPLPGMGQAGYTEIQDPLDPSARIRVNVGSIDSHFVDVLGLRVIYGRAPLETDSNVVLINQSLARRLFGREDVVGEQFSANFFAREQSEIVGVLADLSFGHPAAEPEPYLFSLQGEQQNNLSTLALVETRLTAAGLQQELDRISRGGEIDIVAANVRPLSALRYDVIAADRARGLLTIATALLVVVLAAFGYYGTQRYLVTSGRREYAIRAALGAGPAALGLLVLQRGILMSLPGLGIGGLLAFILVAWLRDEYLSETVVPATVTLAVLALLLGLLLAASIGPARQARRTQPAPLLRED